MTPAFNISPENIVAGDTNLFGEISDKGFSYILQDDKEKKIVGLSVYDFTENENEINVALLLKKIFDEQQNLSVGFKKIFMSFSCGQSLLIPGVYYDADRNSENINRVFGDLQQGIILTDHVTEKNLHTIYNIPSGIYHAIAGQFPAATFIHQYSVIVKQLPQTGTILKIIFYPDKIVAALVIENKLQIIQTFIYVTAEDVVYHMLNICRQFKNKEVTVELSGIIHKDSTIATDIHACFLNVTFAGLPRGLLYAGEIMNFPQHFFSHLFSIALCV